MDDDASVRKALKRLLSANGQRVETYASGPEFLDSLKTCTPDCILLDVHVSPVDGLEVQRELNRRRMAVPVVFISAVGSSAVRKRALAQGAVAYLQKPVTAEALLAVLAEIPPPKR